MLQKSVQVNLKILATPTVQSIMYAIQNTKYTVQVHSMCAKQCTMYTVLSTQYNIHNTKYITVYRTPLNEVWSFAISSLNVFTS